MTTYTIPSDDLGAFIYGGAEPDKLQRTRMDELEIPKKVDVLFVNPDLDYQQSVEHAQRQITTAVGVLSVQLPIVFTNQEAAEIADIILYNLWTERVSYELTLPFKYVYIDPTDRLSITLDGTTHLIRVTHIDYEAPSLIRLKGVAEDNAIYTSNATGGTNTAAGQTVSLTGPTASRYLDIPILRDSDNSNGFYIAGGGYYSSWPGCVVYKSTDSGYNYTSLTAVVNQAKIGSATDALGDTSYPWQWDYANTVNVKLFVGTLSSTSKTNVLAGSNHALVGDEIIGFVNATLEADGSYTLSTLLRGRRGTDQYTGSHIASDRFVLLESTTLVRQTESTGDIGQAYDYKAVTIGKTIQNATNESFTNNSVGLKPFSPVHVTGTRQSNGNWKFEWKRRTRLSDDWRDSVDASLGEASEKYVIDIYTTATASTVVTTLATTTAASATYTSAQVVTDFGAARTTLTIGVFQISETVGRGFQRKVTV